MMNVLVRDGVEPALCDHYEPVDTEGVRRPTIIRGTDDVAPISEHGRMPSPIRGCFSCVSTWDVESLHPLMNRRLRTVELISDLVRTQLLLPVEFVEERFVSLGVL
jgi:hypothetical protein